MAGHMIQQPRRQKATSHHGTPRWITITSEILALIPFLSFPLEGTCQIVLLFAYRTTCIILLRRTFLNKQCIALDYYRILYSLFIYMFIHDIQHPYTLVRPIRQGLKHTPQYGVRSPKTFDSAAPRTYSIICISSESCLGSIVGLAWLPCFGALRSVILAKVAQGELLRLCPGSSG